MFLEGLLQFLDFFFEQFSTSEEVTEKQTLKNHE